MWRYHHWSFCKVGGEVNNVLLLGYSNKGHDGFLGNAVVGEWCNIGAATDASNLKIIMVNCVFGTTTKNA